MEHSNETLSVDDFLKLIQGTFSGKGQGSYPTITSFPYEETVVFERLGDKPIFSYRQSTKHAETGKPLHCESGYLRCVNQGIIEWTIAQPTGIVEVAQGKLDFTTPGVAIFELVSASDRAHKSLGRSKTAKDPATLMVTRKLTLSKSGLFYTMDMATETTPCLTRHLECNLKRKEEET